MAAQVALRLTAAQGAVTGLIEAAADAQRSLSDTGEGMPQPVADMHHDIVSGLDAVARLQAAAARLASEPAQGGCTTGCPCATAANAQAPQTPQFLLAPQTGEAPPIACTLGGGAEAMRNRIGDWQQVMKRATGRRPVEGGVILSYEHDELLTIELARLAAAEFTCCPFFEFSLSVGPTGMTFAVYAPEEARDVVTAMFGAYGSVSAGAR
jgi:hypothetical protein